MYSFLFFIGSKGTFVQLRSLGDKSLRGTVTLDFMGELSDMPLWSCIDSELARYALMHFFLTGELTNDVTWIGRDQGPETCYDGFHEHGSEIE
jgi:hypothetical protein